MSELATFAAGCFWGVELTFQQTPGVTATRVGYIGGQMDNPTYRDVCTGTTGHAEAVEVTYEPDQVSYDQLLAIFFANHDPTQVNRQGPDTGTQYRTAVFYHTTSQQTAAEAAKQVLDEVGRFPRPIATQIVPATIFYTAEDYHQKYLEKRGLGVCHT